MKKKQTLLGSGFGKTTDELVDEAMKNDKYTDKVDVPIYEPKNEKPNLSELIDRSKTDKLVAEINNSGLGDDEKAFLINAAQRHTVFNFAKIADYYAYASPEMKDLMEKSALVIIDYNKAIEYGFVKLQKIISDEYNKLKKEKDEK